ncbi:MAG TPA: hypothetical protein VJ397_10175 [Thermoplasmata archaeon]|nr:hypothetical protein [Thermoplasmata archaeon]
MAEALQPLWDFFGGIFASPVYTLLFFGFFALLPILYFYLRFRSARKKEKWESTGFGFSIGAHGKR